MVAGFLRAAGVGPAGLVLEGAAGIGKSMLWLTTVDDARARGSRVLVARAPPHPRRSCPTHRRPALSGAAGNSRLGRIGVAAAGLGTVLLLIAELTFTSSGDIGDQLFGIAPPLTGLELLASAVRPRTSVES